MKSHDRQPLPNHDGPVVPPRRDSLFSEKIRWEGRPAILRVPAIYRLASWVMGVTALVTALFFVASTGAVPQTSPKMLLTAFWAASVSVLVRGIPLIWLQGARFTVTDRHVIWQRGRFKRMIQRDGVSYARIHWYRRHPTIGDLDLVRAVPTGALRRKLSIRLQGVQAPEKVWAIIRNRPPPCTDAGYAVGLSERLERDEQIMWQGNPKRSPRLWLPLETRRWGNVLLGLLVMLSSLRTIFLGPPLARRLVQGGIPASSLEFVSLFGAMGFTVALLLGFSGWLLYLGIFQEPRRDRHTHYYLTKQRLIVQVGSREIHVVLSHVIDLMIRSNRYGSEDVFLVLDGPRARAFSVQGAFETNERNQGPQPVLLRLSKETRKSLMDAMNRLGKRLSDGGDERRADAAL